MLKCPHNRIQSQCKECLANKDNIKYDNNINGKFKTF